MNVFLARLRETFRRTPVTADLVVINTVMFVVTLALGGFQDDILFRLGALVPVYVTAEGEWFRLLTSMFLHGSYLHFAMNMIALYYLGTAMERGLGPLRYFALYLIAGLGGGLAIVFLGDPISLTIGASGALYGIMAGLFYITFAKKNWFVPSAVRSIRTMIAINFAITFLYRNISILGHLGGFVCGLLAAFFLIPKTPYFMRFRGLRRTETTTDDDDDDGVPPS